MGLDWKRPLAVGPMEYSCKLLHVEEGIDGYNHVVLIQYDGFQKARHFDRQGYCGESGEQLVNVMIKVSTFNPVSVHEIKGSYFSSKAMCVNALPKKQRAGVLEIVKGDGVIIDIIFHKDYGNDN